MVNYASEISGNIDAGLMKQLISGEPVEARHPYGRPFTLKRYAKMMFNGNNLPKTVDHSLGYFRRLIIIPFNLTIPLEERDSELATSIITSELAGVFNWLLKGLSRLVENKGFSACSASDNMVGQYRTESDSVAKFMHEKGYKTSPSKYLTLSDLYAVYKEFCLEDGYRAVGKSNFRKRLEGIKYLVSRKKQGMVVFAELPIPEEAHE